MVKENKSYIKTMGNGTKIEWHIKETQWKLRLRKDIKRLANAYRATKQDMINAIKSFKGSE